ncbi:hypothetical protein G6F22_015583 [Rhizopus arrhizus]|nr:hypothetical protein G6F22_015583 [Rhizopus arrhizus]
MRYTCARLPIARNPSSKHRHRHASTMGYVRHASGIVGTQARPPPILRTRSEVPPTRAASPGDARHRVSPRRPPARPAGRRAPQDPPPHPAGTRNRKHPALPGNQ